MTRAPILMASLLALSAWRPYDLATWAMEVAPVVVVLAILWRWILNPTVHSPGTLMPVTHLTADQADDGDLGDLHRLAVVEGERRVARGILGGRRVVLDRDDHQRAGRDAVDHVIPTHVHLDHAGGVGLLMQHLPAATAVVHPRGARHMIDPSALVAGATAVYGEAEMARSYGVVTPVPAAIRVSRSRGCGPSRANSAVASAEKRATIA